MNDKLFVYGTLLDADNKYGVYLRDNSSFFSSARIRGKLFDIGEYPGVVLFPEEDDFVFGIILQMDEPETILALIDIYEGYGHDQPQPNEFIRVLTQAETESGLVDCWIYVYNMPYQNVPQIASGNYLHNS
jgi:gamma-glutamylcyclotransferase (GGCT)/AIG2-like uncharacterized protein YtfP